MNAAEIQKEIDALVPLMVEKGWRQPEAQVWFQSDRSPRVFLQRSLPDYRADMQFIETGETLADTIANAREFISELPDPEEARKQEFITQLAALIDLGRENGIDLAFVNPLQETMKRLAENALTHETA